MIIPDFETRSRVDLRKCGSSVYARHESTEILCLAWIANESPVRLWVPGDSAPTDLFEAIASGELVCPHNAGFERQIWHWICHKRLGWPDVSFKQWRCTLACCSRLTLPRGLEGAGSALGLSVQKDDAGHRLMLKMCKPRKETKNNDAEWHETPEDLQRLYEYCERDVETQDLLSRTVEPLTGSELKVWQLDQRINLRGIPVDIEGVRLALNMVEDVQADVARRIHELTEGEVSTPRQVESVRNWLTKHECDLPNLSAETVRNVLAGELTESARTMLELRQAASKASTAKLQAFLLRSDEDNRVRNNLMYYGAATGRWSGAGVQVQNFPRGILHRNEVELTHRLLKRGNPRALELILGAPLDCISSSLRSFIRAPKGSRLMVCDFASIEARVLAWVAGQDDLVAVFREGGDVYKVMAASIYGKPIDEIVKTERQMGKLTTLACGFGMGHKQFVRACQLMGGVRISRSFAKQVVTTYRETNDRIKAFWGECNTACIRAIQTGHRHQVGKLVVEADANWLTIRLPSGRRLHYRKPDLVEVRAPWSEGFEGKILLPGHNEELTQKVFDLLEQLEVDHEDLDGLTIKVKQISKQAIKKLSVLEKLGVSGKFQEKAPQFIHQIEYQSVNSVTRKWSKTRTYGGKICENITQAIARDFLVEAMLRLEQEGYPIIATVHDEVISEVPDDHGSLDEFEHIMQQVPTWGAGCPISGEGYEAERYRK